MFAAAAAGCVAPRAVAAAPVSQHAAKDMVVHVAIDGRRLAEVVVQELARAQRSQGLLR